MRVETLAQAGRKPWLALGLLLLCVSFLPAHAAEVPVTGDWLVSHMLSDPEQLNPLTSNDGGSASILNYIFENLLDHHPQTLELRPQLATARPQISDDLVDDYTLRLVAKEPYFLNETVLSQVPVLPRHYYDPDGSMDSLSVTELAALRPGDAAAEASPQGTQARKFAEQFNTNFSRNPMGSGPYKFHSWQTGQAVVLQRDPHYWGIGKEGIDQPYIDQRTMRVFNNPDAALVALKAGELDTMPLMPIQHLKQTSGARFDKQFAKHQFFTPSYSYIGWNNAHPLFSDMRVRQAMTYLTNRQQMVKTLLFELGEVVNGPIYLFRPEYDKTLVPYPYDPQKALQLLGEAGWKDTDGDGILDKMIDGQKVPFRFEIKFNSGNEIRKSVALTLQDELKKHGVDANVRQLDWTIYLDDVRNHKFEAVILGWGMPAIEPDEYQVWHSSQAENKGSNHVSYKNTRADALLEEYRRTFDAQKRVELYREFQQILHQEQPYTFLFIQKAILAVDRRFQNVKLYPQRPRPLEWWVPKAQQRYHEVSQ